MYVLRPVHQSQRLKATVLVGTMRHIYIEPFMGSNLSFTEGVVWFYHLFKLK